ncbi:MAG: ABC transporter ATP-binding protein [Treponema sp.]|jgi:branched-chain amino acid transport system ATP-binding protein|nr:ABC transporter ATP-binding protein [Treponema sp.]
MNNILELENINAFYDKSHILFDINIQIAEGQSVCILGRNGVGKSTTMKTIMGMINPKENAATTGKILFYGKNVAGLPAYKISQKGIAYVPQGRHIFPTLTTRENLLISERSSPDGKKTWTLNKIYELFPRLKERENSKGGKLSGGEQQMLAIARGLMQNPHLLLLDEITEGLAPIIVRQLVEIVQELMRRKVSILVAEQNVKFALSVSDDCYILEKGAVAYHEATKLLGKETILRYLGT